VVLLAKEITVETALGNSRLVRNSAEAAAGVGLLLAVMLVQLELAATAVQA
jgi:hypothetical protein